VNSSVQTRSISWARDDQTPASALSGMAAMNNGGSVQNMFGRSIDDKSEYRAGGDPLAHITMPTVGNCTFTGTAKS